jgi:hypothetical protein
MLLCKSLSPFKLSLSLNDVDGFIVAQLPHTSAVLHLSVSKQTSAPFEVILYCYYWYSISSWNTVGFTHHITSYRDTVRNGSRIAVGI